MTAEEIAESIGYYLSKKGEVNTKGVDLIKEYAKQKCKEQREECAYQAKLDSGKPAAHAVRNAPEPEFD